ncbi:unnamed protein product [Urochloa decumbens]|uniref:DUF7870 domain-containing protein n=1 Tax=Urochloa decumbens TaxID=240449 RepID=A0ABC9EQF3_9POAL
MMTAARTMGACNGGLLRRLLRTVLVLSLASLRLALANGDDVHLPALLAELKDRGYLRHAGRAVFLGDAGPFLERSHVAPVRAAELRAIHDESVDLAVVGRGAGVDFGLVDRVLKVGGVAAVIAASRSPPQLPGNYRVSAVITPRSEKNEGVFAAEKTGASTGSAAIAWAAWRRHHRKLLAVPGNKEDVLDGLEGVLLEPPQKRHAIRRLRPKYLPELTGDSLEGYRRRVFIDVAPAPGGGAASWFRKHYPRGRHEFESVRLTAAGEAAEGIGDWLEGNVGEEDYVVVKAGVEAAEEMLRKGAAVVRRVDELFLDCGEGGRGAAGNGNLGRRPYWQCLALYGRLRDQGVAVHQWWSGMLR